MPENNSLAIIGDQDIVLGFAAMGFKVYALEEKDAPGRVLEEVAASDCAICLVQENLYQAKTAQIKTYGKMPLPVFIPFSKDQGTGLLNKIIKDIRIRATGAL